MPKRKRDEEDDEQDQRPSRSSRNAILSSATTTTAATTTTTTTFFTHPPKINSITDDRALRIKASRLTAKLDQGTLLLKSALQLARGFERQKLGRRQKAASHDPRTLLRLREEVIVLKELDLGVVARAYLFKQLVRTARIRKGEVFRVLFPGFYDEEKDGGDEELVVPGAKVKSKAEANVRGLLCKSAAVRDALRDVMAGVRGVLGLDGKDGSGAIVTRDGKSGRGGTDPVRATVSQSPVDHDQQSEDFEGFSDVGGDQIDGHVNGQSSKVQLEDSEAVNGANEANDSDVDDDGVDYTAYDSRLAASSDSDSDDEDRMTLDNPSVNNRNHSRDMSITPSLSDTNDDNDSPSTPPSPPQTSKDSTNTKLKPKTNPKPPPQQYSSTAFLPSLSMGGYYSGGDTDSSDFDDGFDPDRAPAPAKLERKNRRGQRARQQIAEKKYGAKAKHLVDGKPAAKAPSGGSGGWDPRKGAVDRSGNRSERRRGGFTPARGADGATGSNGEAVGKRKGRNESTNKKKDEGPLHPSWEAARKKKLESGTVAFTGKKITFD